MGTVLPARSHYLAVNDTESTGYSLAAIAEADIRYRTEIDDTAGVALFSTPNPSNFGANTLLDAVGFSPQLPALFREGSALISTGSANGEYSFVRIQKTGRPADTGDNLRDFLFVSTDGGLYGGAQSMLGAPGPENSQSPVTLDAAAFSQALVDPAVCPSCGVNRERSLVSEPMNNSAFGTLTIRRKFTNNTRREITRLRFRVVDLTTYPTVSPGVADLRLLNSTDGPVAITGGDTLFVYGTVVEAIPPQGLGGGMNSSLAVTGIGPSRQRHRVDGPGATSRCGKSGAVITLANSIAQDSRSTSNLCWESSNPVRSVFT